MDARMLHVVLRPFVALHVRLDGVQGGERPVAFGAGERFDVAVFVAGQLDVRFERLRAVRTLEGTHIGVGEQVMVVDGRSFVAIESVYKHLTDGYCLFDKYYKKCFKM